jgi:hypothetical protein
MVWAGYNAIPPLIFFIYTFTVHPSEDRSLELSCFWLRHLHTLLGMGAMVCLWFADTTRAGWDPNQRATVAGLNS